MKGWIIDLTIWNSKATIWFKNQYGRIRKITVDYKPEFYLPKNRLSEILPFLSYEGISIEETSKRIFPAKRRKLIKLSFNSKSLHDKVIRKLRAMNTKTYNGDLLHEQKFFFKLGAPALTLVEINNNSIKYVDDEKRIEPPPLSTLKIDLKYTKSGIIKSVIYHNEIFSETLEGSEEYLIESLEQILSKYDPDILVVSNEPTTFIKKLLTRISKYKCKYRLGRLPLDLNRHNISYIAPGRLIISERYIEKQGLAGLEERCRFSMLPPKIAYEWTPGRLVDSRQCYIAYRRGYVIPESKNLNFGLRTAWEIHIHDRGGYLQSSQIGLHENVGVIDFESMFPNIIIHYNISYETATINNIKASPRGLLVDVVKPILKRRLYFKHLRNKVKEPYRRWADQRQNELKLLLVSCYGYSGNNNNRFGNPVTFEWINRMSRILMNKVYMIVSEKGFKIIYSDTDSIFIKKNDATYDDFMRIKEEIRQKISLPVSLDKVYKFLIFTSTKSNNHVGSNKRYFGKLIDGRIDYTGIEAVRKDYPQFIKRFQSKIIEILLDAETMEEVYQNIKKCNEYLRKAIKEILDRKVNPSELVVMKTLRKNNYKVMSPHYIASKQLKQHNIEAGKTIRYIYKSSKHHSRFLRVLAWPLNNDNLYDKEKYINLLIDAYNTVISPLIIREKDTISFDFSKDGR